MTNTKTIVEHVIESMVTKSDDDISDEIKYRERAIYAQHQCNHPNYDIIKNAKALVWILQSEAFEKAIKAYRELQNTLASAYEEYQAHFKE